MNTESQKLELKELTAAVTIDMQNQRLVYDWFVHWLRSVSQMTEGNIQNKGNMAIIKHPNGNTFINLEFVCPTACTIGSFEEYMMDFIYTDLFSMCSVSGWKIQSQMFYDVWNINLGDLLTLGQEARETTTITILDSPSKAGTGCLLWHLYMAQMYEMQEDLQEQYDNCGFYSLKNIPLEHIELTKQLIDKIGLKYVYN